MSASGVRKKRIISFPPSDIWNWKEWTDFFLNTFLKTENWLLFRCSQKSGLDLGGLPSFCKAHDFLLCLGIWFWGFFSVGLASRILFDFDQQNRSVALIFFGLFYGASNLIQQWNSIPFQSDLPLFSPPRKNSGKHKGNQRKNGSSQKRPSLSTNFCGQKFQWSKLFQS